MSGNYETDEAEHADWCVGGACRRGHRRRACACFGKCCHDALGCKCASCDGSCGVPLASHGRMNDALCTCGHTAEDHELGDGNQSEPCSACECGDYRRAA